MKTNLKFLQKIFTPILGFLLIGIFSYTSFAAKKIKPKINLDYYSIDNSDSYLETRVRYREKKRYIAIDGIELKIFLNEVSVENLIGKIKTDFEGKARFNLNSVLIGLPDSIASYKLIATLSDHPKYKDVSKAITVSKALLTAEIDQTDSLTKVTFNLSKHITGQESTGVEGEGVKVYIERFLGILPIGDEYTSTDENGNMTVIIPTDIPKDINGNIVIFGKVEDHDEFGNLIVEKRIEWNAHRETNLIFNERSLWASRDKTPFWLLIFPNIIIISVWGTLIYLLYLLYRIRIIGK